MSAELDAERHIIIAAIEKRLKIVTQVWRDDDTTRSFCRGIECAKNEVLKRIGQTAPLEALPQENARLRERISDIDDYAEMIPLHLPDDADPHIKGFLDQIRAHVAAALSETHGEKQA